MLLFLIMARCELLAQAGPNLAQLRDSFAHPPEDCRIMMRWWWFGPGVTKPEIRRELEQMTDAGIGGVEIATLYPLALDDSRTGFHNLPYLSEDYLDALRFTSVEAKKLGLRVDITLGSGWPFGGPHISIIQAAGQLRVESVAIPAGAKSVAVPDISTGEEWIAVFLVPGAEDGTNDALKFGEAKQLGHPAIQNGRLQIPAEATVPASAIFFISSRTGMMVKRPAVGAEGFVLDHYDQNATASHLHAVGDRLMEALGENPPYAVFSDSLEDYGSSWTGDLLQQFRRLRGYDLTPHLPALIANAGPETSAVRHDWGRTLTELANEHFLEPLHAWATQHRTLLRSQTYGFPPVTLYSNRFEDLPEGEGKATMLMWREFSDTRWAASAGHLFGKPVISSETWTWLHSPAFRATPLDMKAEADLHFLQGINQLVGHGWPYSPEVAGEPGWRMYAAAALNTHNPWWSAMPDLAGYLQRVSFAMRQGQAVNDVALLLPNDDVWASFSVSSDSSAVTTKGGFNTRGENLSIDESMGEFLGKKVISQVLDAGFNLDFIDGDAIDAMGIRYPVLVLPGLERLPLETYQKIEEYARHGGIVIATRHLPSTAPGLLNAERESRQIQEISQRLFRAKGAVGHFIEDEGQMGAALAGYLKPDVVLSPKTAEIGFMHRHLNVGDLYFVANTSNRVRSVKAAFRQSAKFAESWDPFTGKVSPIVKADSVELSLQPYESRLILFTNSALKGELQRPADTPSTIRNLSSDWTLTFAGSNRKLQMARLHSWSDEPDFQYYSGQVTYEKTFDRPANPAPGASFVLDFGEGTPVPTPDPVPELNMRAYLEGPVREAAEVYVNGQRAGVVWHPPYTIDLSPFVKAGSNDLRIIVGNTAINSLSGSVLPDYRLLNDRYGERFSPQGMSNLQPLPSGLIGDVQLKISQPRRTSLK